MDRRTALAIALSVTAVVGAAGAAFAANVGLLARSDDPVGELQISDVGTIITTPSTPHTIVVDVPVHGAAPDGAGAPVTDATPSRVGSDDDTNEHDDEHEHEGIDDDD